MNVFYNDFKSIYSQLYTLPRARIQLRRNFGKYPKDVDMKTKVSFYEVVGGCSCIKKLDDLNLFIVTLRRWSYFTPTSFTSSTRQPILLAVALE